MRLLLFLAALLASWATFATALYTSSSPVTILDDKNFDSKLKRGAWLVEFYAPWCGHCKALTPEWEKAAKALDGIVGVAALDADTHKQLAGQYGVQGFPTIKFMYYDGGKLKSQDYKGGRVAKDIIEYGMDKAKALALKRAGLKGSKSGGSGASSGGSGGGGGGGSGGGFYSGSSGVINLTEGSFDGEVLESDELWFVEFYAPWCGHCKNLKPEYIDAAKQLSGKVKLGAINCDDEKSLCSKYSVQGFPTIKFFGKSKSRPEDYQGGRDAPSLVAFGSEKWSRFAPPPEVVELSSEAAFAQHCTGGGNDSDAKQLCLIAFLPDILDSKAEGRNAYIKTMQQTAEAFKDRPYSYLWAAGGAHSALEAAVDVGGFGYPALVALSPKKGVYVMHKGALTKEQVREFVGGIRTGANAATKLRGELAPLATVEPWDGKDGAAAVEDEFSLDDIMGEL